MAQHGRTAAEIDASDQAAEAFFARRRSVKAMRELVKERDDPRLRAAIAEASGKWAKWDRSEEAMLRRTAREGAFARALASPLLDAESRALLPAPRLGNVNASATRAHERAARRFYDRVAGADLTGELRRVYTEWVAAEWRRVHAADTARVMRAWLSAPVDPISDEEYADIASHTRTGRQIHRRQVEATWTYRPGRIIPAGMTLERALQIADAAAAAINDGDTSR